MESLFSPRPEDPKNHCQSNDGKLRNIGMQEIEGLCRAFQTRDEQAHDTDQVQHEN